MSLTGCVRRQLKENLGKSKVFEKAREQVINFENPYRTTAPSTVKCRIRLGEERMEEGELKYLGAVLYKHGSMEGGR